MLDYSMIAKVAVTPSSDEANQLLEDWWTLLDLYHDTDGSLLFVLGRQRHCKGLRLRERKPCDEQVRTARSHHDASAGG